jgi:hypothetical protein
VITDSAQVGSALPADGVRPARVRILERGPLSVKRERILVRTAVARQYPSAGARVLSQVWRTEVPSESLPEVRKLETGAGAQVRLRLQAGQALAG